MIQDKELIFFMEKGLKGAQITISCLVIENFIWIKSLFKCHLSYKATFSLSQRWPLNTGLTVSMNLKKLK